MKPSEKIKNELLDWIKAVAIAVVGVGTIHFFLIAPVIVDGESMMPSLEHGDRLFVNKVDYAINEPERFDVVVFHASKEKDYIKRVIGLPGDHIAYEGDQLLVNEEPINEPHLDVPKELFHNENMLFTDDFTLQDITGESVIPDGYVFVLGDNRKNSMDSRVIGLIPMDEIVGTSHFVFWPFTDMGTVAR